MLCAVWPLVPLLMISTLLVFLMVELPVMIGSEARLPVTVMPPLCSTFSPPKIAGPLLLVMVTAPVVSMLAPPCTRAEPSLLLPVTLTSPVLFFTVSFLLVTCPFGLLSSILPELVRVILPSTAGALALPPLTFTLPLSCTVRSPDTARPVPVLVMLTAPLLVISAPLLSVALPFPVTVTLSVPLAFFTVSLPPTAMPWLLLMFTAPLLVMLAS